MQQQTSELWRLRLADRYVDLGLGAAARALLERVARHSQQRAAAAEARRRLSRLSLALDADLSLAYAQRADQDEPSAASAVAVGEAALAAGRFDLAQQAFRHAAKRAGERPADVDDSVAPSEPADHWSARAFVGGAAAAHQREDHEAARAALEQLLALPSLPETIVDDVADVAAAAGLADVVLEALDSTHPAPAPGADVDREAACWVLLRALLLGGARGGALRGGVDRGDDAERAAHVRELLEAASVLPLARLNLALRLARRRGRDPRARKRAVELLEALTGEDEEVLARGGVSPARVQLLLASIYDDEADLADLAASHYEDALSRLPRDAYACNNLGVIALRGGDGEEALRWLTRALESDPRHETSYLNIARLLYVTGTPRHMVAVLEAIDHAGLDARCLANLSFALIEVAREDAHQGLATKGHQLKNLLGVIGSRLRSLARKQSDEASGAALGRLADKVTALYDEWAVYLRTMREEPARHDSFSVNELVSDAAKLAGGRVALRLGEQLPELYGMREQLLEALVNLIRNGQEAQRDLDTSGPPLRVSTKANASETALQIVVEDRGPGIPPADLRRIFAPGYTTKRDGSGLGLAIAERVVRSHEGQLQIDSAPGQGTRVRISLPVGLESEVQHKRRRLPLLSVVRSAAAVEYVVEDEELAR